MIAQYIYRHPRYFALIILCVFAVGLNSLSNIPRQEEPTLTNFAGNRVLFEDGVPIALLEGGEVTIIKEIPAEKQWEIHQALIRETYPGKLKAYLGKGKSNQSDEN